MNDRASAFAFLIARTTRNRAARQLARLRNPRYALAAIFGLAYVWFFLLRGPSGQGLPRGTPRGAFSTVAGMLAGIVLMLVMITYWLGGRAGAALAFDPAEVQLLFSAPVTRRALIGYKVVRSQLLLLISCVIWTLLIRRWGVGLSAPMRYATAWGVLSVLTLHRLGVALLRVPPVRGGRRVALGLGRALAGAAVLALLVAAAPEVFRFGQGSFQEAMSGLGAALAAPPAGYLLAPFQWVVAPMFAQTAEAWLKAFAILAGIVALHLGWVLAMQPAFEEVAAEASVKRAELIAAFKARRAGATAVPRTGKPQRGWLPLAPLGPPAVAIVWKNTIALLRGGALRIGVFLIVIFYVVSRVMGAGSSASAGATAEVPFVTLLAMTLLMGPRMVRNDLRQDLLRLASLKSYPLRGSAIVGAELASPTLVLTGFQLVMLAFAYSLLPASARDSLGARAMVGLAAVAPFALLALNAANVAIQNAAALLFPSWVRLGADSGGIEAVGQNLLVTLGSVLVLLLGLVGPTVAGAVVYYLARQVLGAAGLAAAIAAGALVLGLEIGVLVRGLGGVFERMDAGEVG